MLKHVFIKTLLNNNASALKEDKGSYGVHYIQFLSK